ncbi:DNA helicase [Tropicibacter sp. R16_0]|uniref:DNA helicase n=1 Tax=Tropicibacter sp. R16_0 TaxID=2821102 RepID=UPI001ADBB4B6|nr:DNA helicase [Tropicibacter sp. R16_0]MBO9450847.1 DNA helicase [Tropicibacter sp. R16_0]
MQISAPIYVLKRKAKEIARHEGMALHQALDQVAVSEGLKSWSHLAAACATASPATEVLRQVKPGDMILIGARPRQGKTLLGLEVASRAAEIGRRGYVFTLEYNERDVNEQLSAMGAGKGAPELPFVLDTSDQVSAEHIIRRLETVQNPAIIVVDYLQLLDQRRQNPALIDQMMILRRFVRGRGHVCAMLSQIDRAFDLSGRAMPGVADIRQPNPLDLSVFDGFCFLHNGEIRLDRAA